MLLLVGLGNPGPGHARQRHNVGFRAADAIHAAHNFPQWRKRFSSELAEQDIAGERVVLLKPQTYMNISGQAVGEAARFYKIEPADIVVIYDELDLPAGKTRIKAGGGTAGHNGMRSLVSHVGPDFRRLRIGIGRPGDRSLVTDYVLHDFAKADEVWLQPLMKAIADNVTLLVKKDDATFANRLHAAVSGGDVDTRGNAGSRKASEVNKVEKKPDSESKPAKAPRADENRHENALARGLRRLFGR